MSQRTFEIGPIRPPSEAHSLLLRVTRGCTWNKCRFCNLYRRTQFRFYPVKETKEAIDAIAAYKDRILSFRSVDNCLDHQRIIEDIGSYPPELQNNYYMVYNWVAHGCESVFLQDGNTMAVKPEYLIEVLEYLRQMLPEIKRVTSYGRADSLAKIEEEQYIRLKNAGLDRIHSGFESGSDEVLAMINKGITSAEEINAGKRIMKSGIELSVYFMPGIGGEKLSFKNAAETADVINAIDPSFVRLRTGVIKRGSELYEMAESGTFVPSTDIKKVKEIALLLENIKDCRGTLLSDHIINLIPEVEGRLDKDRERMLSIIYGFLSMPEQKIKRYQLAKRAGIINGLSDFGSLGEVVLDQIDSLIASVNNPADWERLINRYLNSYI